ncbi:hypothetical protein OD91_0855 [Lutibacter sp. Hel_I_33_5]|uniref:hypothetical protein n=1 Tax=Lutibacter sp. Hel_I_33_5 TaxID=1566289 RepID=UPI0011A497F7|nr:hypothetical protein [Lutibacter sp. Hel_I_33_5]TVZ55600.1 hypothetical protein OD91_0855 [Lutibacter sp. Hel_I_33_5]
MLVAISSKVYSDLSTFSGLTALLDNGVKGVRPLIAEEKDGDAFVTYFVRYQGTESKDNAIQFQLITESWAKKYDDSLAIADQVTAALGVSTEQYRQVSGTPKYTEENIIYTEQIFNILK